MIEFKVVFSINNKIIEKEYEVISEKEFQKSNKDLAFTVEEYEEYLQIILNNVIKRSGGEATTPFKFNDSFISNQLSVAFTSVGEYIDTKRDMRFIPVSEAKDFSLSSVKFQDISAKVKKFSDTLSAVSRIPGPRSAELPEVMTSIVKDNIIYAINDAISPTAITNCAFVNPTLSKSIAYAEQQYVGTEVNNYLSKLDRM